MPTLRTSSFTIGSGGVCSLPPSGWDAGTDTGTLVGNVWTPARGASGKVTAASVALIPLSTSSNVQWVEVAGTRLDGLDSVVKGVQPGWSSLGSGDPWNSVLSNYSGAAWDVRAGTERAFVAVSGGHFGGSNDGTYSVDFRRMSWSVEQHPADQSGFDTAYKIPDIYTSTNSFTNYTLSSSYYGSNQTNSEGVYNDEFFDPAFPTSPTRSPRRPTARHQYCALVFVPELGAAGRLISGTRRYWEYDIATRAWLAPKFPFGVQSGYGGDTTGYSGQYCAGFWHSSSGRYFFGPTQGNVVNGGHVFWSSTTGGANWVNEGYFPFGGNESEFVAWQQRGDTVWGLVFNPSGNQTTRPYQMREINLGTRATVAHAITLGASLSGKTWPTNDYDFGPGMTWVPWISKWLCNLRTVENGYAWAWLDPATWTIDLVTEFSGAAVANPAQTMLNKIMGFEAAGLLTHIHVGDQNLRVARFA